MKTEANQPLSAKATAKATEAEKKVVADLAKKGPISADKAAKVMKKLDDAKKQDDSPETKKAASHLEATVDCLNNCR